MDTWSSFFLNWSNNLIAHNKCHKFDLLRVNRLNYLHRFMLVWEVFPFHSCLTKYTHLIILNVEYRNQGHSMGWRSVFLLLYLIQMCLANCNLLECPTDHRLLHASISCRNQKSTETWFRPVFSQKMFDLQRLILVKLSLEGHVGVS